MASRLFAPRPFSRLVSPSPTRCSAALATVLLALVAHSSAAHAASVLAQAQINPGALTVSAGAPTTDPRNPQRLLMPLEVIDARGNGAGWSVYMSARSTAGPTASLRTLSAPSIACATNSTCTLPQSSVSYPLDIPLTGVAVKILNAADGTGMGAVVTTLSLDGSPTNQPVNTTVTVASGP